MQAEVDTARTLLRDIEASLADRVENDDEIRGAHAALRHDLQEIELQLGALPLPDESPALTSARMSKLSSDREATVQLIEVLTQERENLEARRELLPLRRDRWTRRINQLTGLEAAWQKIVDDARAKDIRRKRDEATRAQSRAHPGLEEVYETNSKLLDRRDKLQPDSEQAQQDLVGLNPDPETLRRQLDRLRQKVDVVGMTSTVGRLLRRNRADLPDTRLTERAR